MYFLISSIVVIFILIVAPFCLFPDKMDHYGSYLTGVAAMGAALKFATPYLLILFYRKRYSNELLWNEFLNITSFENENHILECDWIGGLINYFRRCEETLHKGNPWYNKLPSMGDSIYIKFGRANMVGNKENNLFSEIKKLLLESAEIVAMNSTPDKPMVNDDKYKRLHSNFKLLVEKTDEMNTLLIDVPRPIKQMIETNDLFRSFFKR